MIALTVPAGASKCQECQLKAHLMKRANVEALPKFHRACEAGERKKMATTNGLPWGTGSASAQAASFENAKNLGLLSTDSHGELQQDC
jgi:hypothetical protein